MDGVEIMFNIAIQHSYESTIFRSKIFKYSMLHDFVTIGGWNKTQ